jgi:kynurenine formamidase
MIDASLWRNMLNNVRVIDLSQTLEEHAPHYPTHSKFYHNLWNSYWHGERSLSYQITMNEHSGTHVDAPAHFISDAKPEAHTTIDRVPVASLIGRGVRLDCRKYLAGGNLSRDFVESWEKDHGAIEARDIVLMNFGWSSRWALRPGHESYVTDWPGVSMEAAEYLLEKEIAALGVDSLSADSPAALRTNPIHPRVLERQVLLVENLCNLDRLPDFFIFLALPLKIRDGSGSPVRAVAFV